MPTLINLDHFFKLSIDDLSDWLEVGINRFFVRSDGPSSLAPFETYLISTGSAAEAIWAGLQAAPPEVMQRFRRSLSTLPSRLDADPQIWAFITELVLRVDAVNAIDAIERRLTEPFLAELVSKNPEILDDMVRWIRNVSPAHVGGRRPLARLLSRLAVSGHMSDSQARIMLLRLCEIDPDHWTSHFALLRDLLHSQFTRIRTTKGFDKMIGVQNDLAMDVLSVIGSERYLDQFTALRYMRDPPGSVPSDNWVWRALLERLGSILPDEQGKVASAARPSDRRAVTDRALDRSPMQDPASAWEANLDSFDSASLAEEPQVLLIPQAEVDWALGPNSLQPMSEDAELSLEDA